MRNIPTTWKDTELRQHFQQFGNIMTASAPESLTEPGTGINRGYAFVTFDKLMTAQAVKQAFEQPKMAGYLRLLGGGLTVLSGMASGVKNRKASKCVLRRT